MCGRYALALRLSQIRQMLQDDDMPVDEAPPDEADEADDDGPPPPRQSYNFAPGYHGVVYRADVPDWGAGPRKEGKGKAKTKTKGGNEADSNAVATASREGGKEDTADDMDAETDASSERRNNETADDDNNDENENHQSPQQHNHTNTKATHYKLQSMKWGLIPFWTKRNPDYGAVMKTINCRDDSLSGIGTTGGSMWNSMKGRKRCIVLAQGFYEWLKSNGGKEKVPHFVKRRDGKLMCFAGLWDCVQYEGDSHKTYTYTIITTSSNAQLSFLHDRMPVILDPGSPQLATWLDPAKYEWSAELQSLLKPFGGELEVYPVSKEVGKVGNNSPMFVVPVASRENKANIANFFANARGKKDGKKEEKGVDEVAPGADDGGMGMGDITQTKAGIKRKAGEAEVEVEIQEDSNGEIHQPPKKKATAEASTATTISSSSSPTKVKTTATTSPKKSTKSTTTTAAAAKNTNTKTISATNNGTKSPAKGRDKAAGTQKITKFFGNSA